MTLTPTISVLELFVVVIGIVGCAVSLSMMAILWRDRGILKAEGQNGIDRRLVMGNMRNEIARLLILVGYIGLGIYAMSIPEPVRAVNRRAGEVTLWIFVAFEVIVVLASLWDYVDRQRNIADLAKRRVVRDRQQERNGEADHQPPVDYHDMGMGEAEGA